MTQTVTATIVRSESISKEIELPYHSKDGNRYFRINEDRTVLYVLVLGDLCAIRLGKSIDGRDAFDLGDALKATECSADEVESAVQQAIEFMDNVLSQTA